MFPAAIVFQWKIKIHSGNWIWIYSCDPKVDWSRKRQSRSGTPRTRNRVICSALARLSAIHASWHAPPEWRWSKQSVHCMWRWNLRFFCIGENFALKKLIFALQKTLPLLHSWHTRPTGSTPRFVTIRQLFHWPSVVQPISVIQSPENSIHSFILVSVLASSGTRPRPVCPGIQFARQFRASGRREIRFQRVEPIEMDSFAGRLCVSIACLNAKTAQASGLPTLWYHRPNNLI